MMKLFIASEAIFFLALILSYLYFWRFSPYVWTSTKVLSVKTAALFTLLLVASSLTFWKAERVFEKGNPRQGLWWLGATIGLGIVFLLGQGHEYWGLLHQQVTVSSSTFGSSFYTLTGFHGLHVFLGLFALIVLWLLAFQRETYSRSGFVFRTVGIYWHFVDAVWLVVFTVIYLLPYLTGARF